MVRLVLLVAAALALTCGGTATAKLDLATVNQAQFSAERSKGFSPVILPGLIEGRFSENVAKGIRAFQTANGFGFRFSAGVGDGRTVARKRQD